ncbi:hypothetical protein C8R44DRAFT_740730 [Mycena epipterygia]|nr:hypothetical protein C8R44DRAFT_740730 [Mycena epipterygia]
MPISIAALLSFVVHYLVPLLLFMVHMAALRAASSSYPRFAAGSSQSNTEHVHGKNREETVVKNSSTTVLDIVLNIIVLQKQEAVGIMRHSPRPHYLNNSFHKIGFPFMRLRLGSRIHWVNYIQQGYLAVEIERSGGLAEF